jgi:hypothetical protein
MHKALLIVFVILFSFENSISSVLNSIQKIDITEQFENDVESSEESEKNINEDFNFSHKINTFYNSLSSIILVIQQFYFSSEANCIQSIVIDAVYSPPE